MTDPVFDMSQAALDCLTMAATGNPGAPGLFCMRVGLEVIHDIDMVEDLCCTGLGYVTLGDTWISSNSFPEQDIVRQANAVCPPPAWGQTIKMGLVRCIPVMGENGSMPTCEEYTAAHIQNVYDSISLRRAACCLRTWVQTNFLGMSVVIQRQTQGAPLGGCVERSVTIDIQFPNCDCT